MTEPHLPGDQLIANAANWLIGAVPRYLGPYQKPWTADRLWEQKERRSTEVFNRRFIPPRRSMMGMMYKRNTYGRGRGIVPYSKRYKTGGYRKRTVSYRSNRRTGGFIGKELKFQDDKQSVGLVGGTGAASGELDPTTNKSVSAIAEGTGENERIGRRAHLKSIFIQGNITGAKQINQTAADNGCTIMLALVLDTQTNGAQLDSEAVFKNFSALTTLAPHVMRNLQFIQRFKVLQKVMIVVPPVNIAHDGTDLEQAGYAIPFKMYRKLNITVNHSSTGAGIANVTDNSIHVIGYANNTDTVPTINYNSRIRFIG